MRGRLPPLPLLLLLLGRRLLGLLLQRRLQLGRRLHSQAGWKPPLLRVPGSQHLGRVVVNQEAATLKYITGQGLDRWVCLCQY